MSIHDDMVKKDVANLLRTINHNIKLAEKFRKEYQATVDTIKAIPVLDRTIGDNLELSLSTTGVSRQQAIIDALKATIADTEEIFSDYIDTDDIKENTDGRIHG